MSIYIYIHCIYVYIYTLYITVYIYIHIFGTRKKVGFKFKQHFSVLAQNEALECIQMYPARIGDGSLTHFYCSSNPILISSHGEKPMVKPPWAPTLEGSEFPHHLVDRNHGDRDVKGFFWGKDCCGKPRVINIGSSPFRFTGFFEISCNIQL